MIIIENLLFTQDVSHKISKITKRASMQRDH